MTEKATLRARLRAARKEHAQAIPENMRGLILRHPPAPLSQMIPADAVIGIYHAAEYEVPAANYAKHFSEAGHKIALPRFAAERSAMEFAEHSDPFGEADLEDGPYGIRQPAGGAATLVPDFLFVPLIGFGRGGERLGQGGGHYDRWLTAHPNAIPVGLAWDCQLADDIPVEAHDIPLHAVVTPTRFYGPF